MSIVFERKHFWLTESDCWKRKRSLLVAFPEIRGQQVAGGATRKRLLSKSRCVARRIFTSSSAAAVLRAIARASAWCRHHDFSGTVWLHCNLRENSEIPSPDRKHNRDEDLLPRGNYRRVCAVRDKHRAGGGFCSSIENFPPGNASRAQEKTKRTTKKKKKKHFSFRLVLPYNGKSRT